jgi:hypothetical protein
MAWPGRGWNVRPWLVWTAGLALVGTLGAAGLRDEPGQALVAFPAPDVTMPTDDSPLLALMASHDVKDAYAPYWIAYRVMFETGGRTEVSSYDYDRYPRYRRPWTPALILRISTSARPRPSAHSRHGAASTTSVTRNGT